MKPLTDPQDIANHRAKLLRRAKKQPFDQELLTQVLWRFPENLREEIYAEVQPLVGALTFPVKQDLDDAGLLWHEYLEKQKT